MACSDICPKGAVTVKADAECCRAVIDEAKCIDCRLCEKVCQVHNPVETGGQISWHQGWAKDEAVRAGGSSGGAATAIAAAFIRNGGVVYTCAFEQGKFGFIRIDREDELARAKGSKYVKSSPEGVYRKIKDSLKSGEKVLMIGLPCQIAAAKNYAGTELQSGLYTIDLICHGSPAPSVLENYMAERGYSLSVIDKISFRIKDSFGLTAEKTAMNIPGIRDAYTIAFLNGIAYTENCYSCVYAQRGRTGDVTLGDSWQSELPEAEIKKGVSLILTQSEKGEELLAMAELVLCEVNAERAAAANHQLNHPSEKPEKRDEFTARLRAGEKLEAVVRSCYPRQYFKQSVKRVLKKIRG